MLLSIGQAAGTVAMAVQVVLISHLLGLRAYGIFALTVSFVTLVGRFFDLAPARSAIAFGTDYYVRGKARATAGVCQLAYLIDTATGALAFVVVAALAPLVGPGLVGSEWLPLFLLYGVTLVASGFDDTSTALLRMLDRYGVLTSYIVIREFGRLVFTVVSLVMFHSLVALVFALAIHQVLAGGLVIGLTSRAFSQWVRGWTTRRIRLWKPYLSAAREVRRPMLSMTFQMNLITYGRLVQAQAGVLLLGVLAGPFEVGIFKVAAAIAAAVGTLYVPAWNAVLPRLARLWAKRDIRAIRHLIKQGSAIAFVILGAAAVVAIVLRDQLLVAFGGQHASAGTTVLVIMLLAQLINGTLFWNDSLLYAAGRARFVTGVYLPSVAVMFVLTLALVPLWGADGAAAALIASTILNNTGLTIGGIRLLRGASPSPSQPRQPIPQPSKSGVAM